MEGILDSYASFASASYRASLEGVTGSHAVVFTDADDASSIGDTCGLEDEVVDLAAEMAPAFFESGQLMWEIAARTEGVAHDDQLCVMRPEIVLTDSSFLSLNGFQDDPHKADDDIKDKSVVSGTDENEVLEVPNAASMTHGRKHCFELLTDEDDPLYSLAANQEESLIECPQTVVKTTPFQTSKLESLPCKSGTPDSSGTGSPFERHSYRGRVFADDSNWVKQRRRIGAGHNKIRTRDFKSGQLRSPTSPATRQHQLPPLKKTTSAPPDRGTLPVSDSASEIFNTYDPLFIIGDGGHSSDSPIRETPKPLKLTAHTQLQPHLESKEVADEWHIHRLGRDSEPRSPRVPSCSLKDVFASAMAKVNDVVYSCTHTKQRRKEREFLKRLQANSRGNLTPTSASACGAYRRRNTLICQKMEGMINDTKSHSAKNLTRPCPPSSIKTKKSTSSHRPTTT